MEQLERDVLLDKRTYIIDNIDLSASSKLMSRIKETKLFDTQMIEEIEAGRTREERISCLLDKLPKRGPKAFSTFISVLTHDYKFVADHLRAHKEEKRSLFSDHVGRFVRTLFETDKRFPETRRRHIEEEIARFMEEYIQKRVKDDKYERTIQDITTMAKEVSTLCRAGGLGEENETFIDEVLNHCTTTVTILNNKLQKTKKKLKELLQENDEETVTSTEFQENGKDRLQQNNAILQKENDKLTENLEQLEEKIQKTKLTSESKIKRLEQEKAKLKKRITELVAESQKVSKESRESAFKLTHDLDLMKMKVKELKMEINKKSIEKNKTAETHANRDRNSNVYNGRQEQERDMFNSQSRIHDHKRPCGAGLERSPGS